MRSHMRPELVERALEMAVARRWSSPALEDTSALRSKGLGRGGFHAKDPTAVPR
jgi:hypothetical protein